MNKKKKARVYNTVLAASGGLVLSIIWLYALSTGRIVLPVSGVVALFVGFWLVNLVFVSFVASDKVDKLRDPSLSVPQMYWAGATSLITLWYIPYHNMEIYLLLMIILVFGIFKVRPRDFYGFGMSLFVAICMVNLLPSNSISNLQAFEDRLFLLFVIGFCIFAVSILCNSMAMLKNRLKQKNIELNQALQTKSQFLANMSHELRTPMNGVIGMLQIIERDELTESQKRNVSVAQHSAQLMLGLINEVLDFSKLEAEKVTIESVPTSVLDLLTSTATVFHFQAKEKGLSVSCELSTDVPREVVIDGFRIQQILNNLLSNAIKFTEEGGITISCTWDDTSARLCFSVKDTGIGISSENRDALFESFNQADISTTRKYGGTGLGLSISKRLCELLGGELGLESVEGEGSRFYFYVAAKELFTGMLPKGDVEFLVDEQDTDQEVDQEPIFEDESASEQNGSEPFLLIIDDNEVNLEVCAMIVEDIGFDSHCCGSGRDALAFFKENYERIDAVLLDCQMPEMDGYEVCGKIRALEEKFGWGKTPVVAVTANALDGDKERCLAAGMDEYVPKPIDASELETILEKVIA